MIGNKINNERKNKNIIFGDFLRYNGSNDMAQNFSASPVDFELLATKRLEIKSVVLYMQSSSQIHYELFGNISALTNGLRVYYKLKSSSEKIYLDAGEAIKTNGSFGQLSFDVELKEKGSGHNVFTGLWDFEQHFGDKLLLNKGGSFGITVNDNLSGIGVFSIFVKGINLF